ncbi:hypothetical protein BVC80_8997g8 [Macleaya cordata]|uniref:Uncharacterized protein n=1 Tax=Macleaya cordata TaxID=56857 RepID=A0A200QMC0_MACCD|nr:hypothetical protein BVC80_8997g8 [Macleaya cordata]
MGGGGVMKAALKFAGFGFNGGLRGAPPGPLQEQSATTTTVAATKLFSNPAETIVSSPESKTAVFDFSENGKSKSSSSIQRPSWEIDDWEFTDGGEEFLLSDSIQVMPRVIFGGVPTLEEATEATSDLKDALEESFSSVSKEYELEISETKACVTSESVVAFPFESKPVFQAFSLLKESPEAQTVVASLASDKNVWDAVMQNEKVMEFLKLQQTNNECRDYQTSSMCFEDGYDVKHTEGLGDVFMKSIQNLKLTVVEMINNISLFFQDLFGGAGATNISLDANGNARATYVDRIMGSSFMALAVMTIMVVVLKRR